MRRESGLHLNTELKNAVEATDREAKYDASLKNDVYTTNINFFLNK